MSDPVTRDDLAAAVNDAVEKFRSGRFDERITTLEHTVYGNGQQGLTTRVALLDERFVDRLAKIDQDIADINASRDARISGVWQFVGGAALTVLAALATKWVGV